MSATFEKWFPWTQSPVVCNGPMLGVASPKLATEVTKAGGIGFVGSVFDLSSDSEGLRKLDSELTECTSLLGDNVNGDGRLPIGISFITGHSSITKFAETAMPIIAKHSPAAVWLFAPDEEVKPHRAIIQAVKALNPAPRVFAQVGNVTAAKAALEDGADVIVCQGIDAGGHQFRRGMGVVSFVPEARQLVDEKFSDREIGLLAAGGIVNDKGAAAAMVLGADGIVMGTRFTVAEESTYPDFRKKQILDAVDGGSSTFKSPFNDQITSSKLWGPLYDGRAIISTIHEKYMAGSSLEELQGCLKNEYSSEEATKLISTWAGTGVGLVNKAQPAGAIVREVREGAKERVRQVASRF